MAKTVLVTGATGYFGRYFVEHLAQQHTVIALARSTDKLDACFGESIIKVCCDLSDTDAVAKTIEQLVSEHNIDGLINNAYPLGQATGFNTPKGNLAEHTAGMLQQALGAGLVAPFMLAQAVGNAAIAAQRSCSIINISSMYASVAPDPALYVGKTTFNPISYGMTKAGLEYMTKYMASFWGAQGVRSNAIAPGPFPNVETVSENATRDDQFIQRLKDKTTLNQVGHPRDLLSAIDWLLDDGARFVNGQVIAVDGGWTVR